MPIVPARYAYIVVAVVLITIFYTTTIPSYDSAPVFRPFRDAPFSKASSTLSNYAGDGIQTSPEAQDDLDRTLYPPAPRPDAQLEPVPSFQKPDVLPTDDKEEQKWMESQDAGDSDGSRGSSNSTDTVSQQDMAAMPAPANDPATKVYSAESSSPTWSVSTHAEDGSKSHQSPKGDSLRNDDDDDDDTDLGNATHPSNPTAKIATTSSGKGDEGYEFE